MGVDAVAIMTNEKQLFEGDDFDAHSGHTDDEGAVSDYDYFDGDSNHTPSGDEHAGFED